MSENKANIAPDHSPVTDYPTSDLHFDPENPRFYRFNDEIKDEKVIEEMLDDEGVSDLMSSIGQKGYFQGEPLIITTENGRHIVVEGNRRLAAVKLLNGQFKPPENRTASVRQIIGEAIVKPPQQLPCIHYNSRKEVMRYLGYRHITGIREWDALSKAKYLEMIRNEFYNDIAKPEQMKSLAKDIGSRSDYVAKLLTALGLYIKAETQGFYKLPMKADDVEFSYITTALGYANISEWLGLTGSDDIEMPELIEENLKRLFGWMFPRDQQGRTIIGESRNLDQLASIVKSEAAVIKLEETGRLSDAFLFSDGPQEALTKALTMAQEKVITAWELLPDTANFSREHQSLAEKLTETSRDVRDHIRKKLDD